MTDINIVVIRAHGARQRAKIRERFSFSVWGYLQHLERRHALDWLDARMKP